MADANWGSYNLPAIWEMIKHENVCDGADRVLSWDSLAQDGREQQRRLHQARDALASVWPPETNASARVFLEQIAQLVTSLDRTLSNAEDTRVGLRGIMEAIGTAQSTLSPLVEARQAASGDLIPRFIDHAEDDFDVAAQQAMREAEAAIRDHGSQIQAPPLYQLSPPKGTTDTDLPGDSTTSNGSSGPDRDSLQAAPVPVPIPHNPPDLTSGGSSGSGSSTGTGVGPGLAGVAPIIAPAAPGAGTSIAAPGLGSLLPGNVPAGGGLPAGGTSGLVIGGGGALGFGRGGVARTGLPSPRSGLATGRQAVPVRRGLPSGATIGATEPGSGAIGGRGGVGRQPAGGQSAGRGSGSSDSGDELAGGEADVRWGVREGVPPVISPDMTAVDHHPGPGVIGYDE